jgi:N-acyl-D-aspartate/D-glutamate deacylase
LLENLTPPRILFMLHAAALSLLLMAPAADAATDADILIRGATIYDGAGKPAVQGDLAIKGDRIIAVGTFKGTVKGKTIDGAALIVAPGFIDLHTHSDKEILLPATRANLNFLTQGCTTIVTGNCGFGPVDVADYLKKIDEGKAGTNVVHQVPHNDLRKQVIGNANRPITRDELEKMKSLAEKGMRDGAWGLSTGLYYTPGSYAQTEELVELSKIVAAHGGFYASHMRDEGAGLLASIQETLTIGERAKLPVHISHLKAYSRRAWGKAADALALIEQARAKGQTVTADQYPYVASSTSLAADVIPAVYRSGTQQDLVARLTDAEQGPKVRKEIERLVADSADGKSIRIARYTKRPEWNGKDLASIAREEKKSPVDIVIEIEKGGDAQIVHFSMQEEEVRLIMKQPFVATASDGAAKTQDDTIPHPRNYGTFPRKIGRYAIEDKTIPLEQAIRSASGLPADILHLPERGYLKPGYFADIVVFDPKTFRDTATFDKPHQYATGVRYLFVNGALAINDGKYTGELAGRPLRHKAKQ